MANNYSPRRAAPSGEPERRRTSAPRESGYTQERRAPRETGYTSPTLSLIHISEPTRP